AEEAEEAASPAARGEGGEGNGSAAVPAGEESPSTAPPVRARPWAWPAAAESGAASCSVAVAA
ncbi:hypothetical protein KM043_000056, partial [Ampulex compressa]